MPTKTFLNLPQEKQKNIIDASIKEFKRVLLKDASINKIIKDANISRGSFYNYFTDINDIYIYSLNNYKKKFFETFEEILIKTQGDLIKTAQIIYDNIIEYCLSDKTLFKNIFLNMNYHISIRNQLNKEDIENKYKLVQMISKINKKNLNITTEEELFYIIDIIIGFVIHGLIEIFLDNQDPAIIKNKIIKQLEILEKGIYKEE